MYKVFFNEHLICLDTESNYSSLGNIAECVDIERVDGFVSLLKNVENGKYAEQLEIKCCVKRNLLQELGYKMNQLPAAGGIVRNEEAELLFIKRFGRWDLPKGKIEKGESAEAAAVREVEEECGITRVVSMGEIGSTYHIYRSPYLPAENNFVWKETRWFEMFYGGKEMPVPQTLEDIEVVKWFPRNQLDGVVRSTYGNLKLLLESYLG